VSHIDVFSAILCERHTSLDLEAMQELALVTAVIGQAGVEGKGQPRSNLKVRSLGYSHPTNIAVLQLRGGSHRLFP